EQPLVEELHPAGVEHVEAVSEHLGFLELRKATGVDPGGVGGTPAGDLTSRSEELDTSIRVAPGLGRVVHGDGRGAIRPYVAGVLSSWIREPHHVQLRAPGEVRRVDMGPPAR